MSEDKKLKKKNKGYFILSFLVLAIIGGCTYNILLHNSNTLLDTKQIGYYKGSNKLRYYTIQIKNFTSSEINKEHEAEIIRLGSNQMNTSGQVTASFFYGSEVKVPDISIVKDAQKANDIAHNAKPSYSVWIMPNGQINTFKDPR